MPDGKVAREPGGAGPIMALAARTYTDPAVYEQEKERIFFRTWLYAGHVSQVGKTGDYFTFEICDQSLFALRGADGAIRTFYNVCQHRAHELVRGEGTKRVIVCPYHAWTYELDGRLRKAPNDDKVAGFDRAGICLTEVRTEVFCGFIFVNLDDGAEPMAAWFPEAEAGLRAYVPQIDRLEPVAWLPVEEACNWKITVENYNECYHCRINHPTFAKGVVDPDSYNVTSQGHCLRHRTRAAHMERMTYELDPAAGAHAMDYSSWFLWPAFSFQVYPGGVLNTYLWRPLSVDRTLVYRGWYSLDGAPSETVERLAAQDRDTTVAEDIKLVESVQRGLNSRGYSAGPLIIDPNQGVNSEHSIRTIKDWVLEGLGSPAV